MNKRGFFGDVGLVIAILLLVAIIVMVGYKLFSSYNTKWQAMDVDQNAKNLVQDNKDRYVDLFDGIFMFVLALLCVALFISVAMIGTRPEFFFITIILLVIFIGAAALLSNVFTDVATSPQLNATSSEFEFIPFIMNELPTVVLLFGFIVIAGLYMKIRGVL